MAEDLNLDPMFDRSFQARVKRFVRGLLNSRYFLVAFLIEGLILIIFGGHVLFERYQKVNLESDSLIAPTAVSTPVPPPSAAQPEKNFDVKVAMPKTTPINRLATDKLSAAFNVAAPDIQNTVSVSMGAAAGSGSGSGGAGAGFANVSFFGISGRASTVAYVVDISGSMKGGSKFGRSFRDIEREVERGIRALTPSNEFSIIVFGGGARSYKPQLTAATLVEKDQSLKWLHGLNPENDETKYPKGSDPHAGTHAHKGLEMAFQHKAALINFVSDGSPNGVPGGGNAIQKILDMVKGWQAEATPRATVNAVFFKTGSTDAENNKAKEFMENLAKQNGGVFKPIE